MKYFILFLLIIPSIVNASLSPEFVKLVPAKGVSQTNEAAVFASGTSQDILNASPGTPGYVSSIWFACAPVGNCLDGLLKVYVDGESTPSVNTDTGTLCNVHYSYNISQKIGHSHIHIDNIAGYDYSCTFKYPIPYKSSIRITMTNLGAGNETLWSYAEYVNAGDQGLKLWSNSTTFSTRVTGLTPTQQSNGTLQFLNLPAGKSGWVVALNMIMGEATNYSYVENNVVAYRDGLVPGVGVVPQYNTSGTEDAFLSTWSFLNHPQQSPFAYVTQVGVWNNSISAALDYLEYNGGIKFDNGILMRWEGGGSSTNVDVDYLVLYYMPY